jgi:hypothetical protein
MPDIPTKMQVEEDEVHVKSLVDEPAQKRNEG